MALERRLDGELVMSKYSEIANLIKEEIKNGVYAKGAKLPTEYELVERFNASRQTVRQAIASLKNEGIVYQVQGSGTYVNSPTKKKKAEGSALNIQVISTYISDYIFPSIIRGIEHRLAKENISIKLAATGNMVDRERAILLQIINGTDTDAIIVEGTKTAIPNPNISLYNNISEMGIPIVFIHCAYPEIQNPVVVGMDDYQGGKKAVESLFNAGCKKIGAIFKSDDLQGLLRYKGFTESVIELGIGLENTAVRWFSTEDIAKDSFHVAPEQIKEFASYDGIVCYNDQIATSFINDCALAQLKIPQIVSFDKSSLSEVSAYKYISLPHKKDLIGEVAAEKAINMLAGKKESSVFFSWE